VFAAHRLIDKFVDDVVALSIEMPVAPCFEGECGGKTTALLLRPIVGAARGMSLNLIRKSVKDVHLAAVGVHARDSRSEMVVRVVNSLVVLVPKLVFRWVGRGISNEPEVLNEILPLLVLCQFLECLPFFVCDDDVNVIGPSLQDAVLGFFFLRLFFILGFLGGLIDGLWSNLVLLSSGGNNGREQKQREGQSNSSTAHRRTSVKGSNCCLNAKVS